MTTYRSEMFIPISKDSRSFEEHQRDRLNEMERLLNSSAGNNRTAAAPLPMTPLREDWHADMRRRMDERRRRWTDEISQMRDEFFRLKPMEPLVQLSPKGGGVDRTDKFDRYSNTFDQMQALFESGSDGQVHFKARFDVGDFEPEDISVTTRDRKVTVTARHEEKTPTATSSREFSRSIDIPRNVDDNKMSCTLTKDGVLLLDAPAIQPDYSSTLLDSHAHSPSPVATSPRRPLSGDSFGGATSTTGSGSSPRSSSSKSLIESSNPIMTLPNGQRLFRLEISLGGDYAPEEISVKTQNQRVCIHARHEERSANRTSFREFSKEYDIPASVDPFEVVAKFDNGILFLEAPVKQQP